MNTLRAVGNSPDSQTTQLIETTRQTEQERQRDKALSEFAPDGYIITDSYGVILEANLSMAHMLNIPWQFLSRKPFIVFVSLQDRRTFRTNLGRLRHQNEEIVWSAMLLPRQRPLLSVQFRVAPITARTHSSELRWMVRDISQETILEEVLQVERRRLQLLSHRLVEMQETERRNLARELHDEVGQLLTGLKMTLEYSNQQEFVVQTKIGEAIGIAMRLMEQIRTLSLQLRPPMLDTLGLIPTLRWHFERYTAQTRIKVHFKCDQPERRYDPQIELTAYRVIQEALTNIARYAGVQDAWVHISVVNCVLHISIEDFGVGFDYQQIRNNSFSSGLSGMQERVALVGGHLSIESTPGSGTRVQASLFLGQIE